MAVDALSWGGAAARLQRERDELEVSIARALAELGA
jgi:hypothetical protein